MVKLSKLYAYYASNFISRGTLVLRESMSALGIKPVYGRYITKKYVTKVWIIRSFPVKFEENFSAMVRTLMFESIPEARTQIHYVMEPNNPKVDREVFTRQFSQAEDQYTKLKRYREEDTTTVEKRTGKKGKGPFAVNISQKRVDRAEDRFLSYDYVYTHSNSEGEFFKANIFIQASGETNEILERYRKSLEKLLNGSEIYYEEVTSTMSHYLSNYGPAAYPQEVNKKYVKSLVSDENISHITPYAVRGLVGGSGILFGLDWLSKLPLVLNLCRTSSAQIFLIVAMAGEGKTLLADGIILGLLSRGIHCEVIDYKGGEYRKLGFATDYLEIVMGGTSGVYVNTLRLDDVPVDETDCEYIYDLAVKSTIKLFSIVASLLETEGNRSDMEEMFKIAIIKCYDGIVGFNSRNPASFKLTKDIKLEDAIRAFSKLTDSATWASSAELINRVSRRLFSYFNLYSADGSNLKREITLAEIVDSPLVIYSLNKNTNTFMTLDDRVNVFMAQCQSRKKHFVRSKQGLFTAEFYEELTRVEENSSTSSFKGEGNELLMFISQVVTGARSDNVLVFMMLNNLSSFKNPAMQPIKSNITSVVAGKMEKDDIDLLVENFGAKGIERFVRDISLSEDPNFKNCFAIKFSDGLEVKKAMFKVVIPSYMEEELRQRDVVEDF